MLIDRITQDGTPAILEKVLDFTEKRQALLANDVANADVPNFIQKDLSPAAFQKALRERIDEANETPSAMLDLNDLPTDASDTSGLLFHDGNNRSMETLMSEQAKNELLHNVAVELLRQQYATMEMALKDRIG
jgi:flagellar basal-body rod protein FlgB